MKCPYESQNRKCTHKGPAPRKSRRSRHCGYGDPKDCELYCEWFELVKACHGASDSTTDPFEDECNNGL